MSFFVYKKFWFSILISLIGCLSAMTFVSPAPHVVDNADDPGADVVSVFDKTVLADAPTELLLNSDSEKIVGWITGAKRFAGQTATVKIGNNVVGSVEVDPDNSFVWKADKPNPNEIEVSVGDDLVASTTLIPREAGGRFVYFVIDRTAYRPGQTLNFVGFLRAENKPGEIVPLTNTESKVTLLSGKKSTKAAVIPVKSDEFGRVFGEYKFTEADALDSYRLVLPGFTGEAIVKLAEFRKAKVRLDIDSEVQDKQLTLKFRALDFLDKGVEGTDVRFDAKVIYTGDQGSSQKSLDSTDFAIPSTGLHASLASKADANEDEKLLYDFGEFSNLSSAFYRPQTVASINGDVEVAEDGTGEFEFDLKQNWVKGGFSVVVDAVLTDYNGREQRASKTISLGGKVKDCDLVLNLSKRFYAVGEKIPLAISPTLNGKATDAVGTVVAMKLSPNRAQPNPSYGYGSYGYGYDYGYYNHLSHANLYRGSWRNGYRSPLSVNNEVDYDQTKRTLVNAELISGNQSVFSFDEPGAYKLVCIAKLPDGSQLKNEIGCIVNDSKKLPGLILNLDKQEFRSDDNLTGWIHSKVKNAKVMVTLRDSIGIREHQFVELEDGLARLQMKVPEGVRYGATVEVEFIQGEQMLFANRFTRILPVDRMVDLEIKTEETYKPGEMVTVELTANRKQEMDLVVSVFDQSLLGIAKDQSKSVANYFLADERVRWRVGSDLEVRKRLGELTYRDLVEGAREAVREFGNHERNDAYFIRTTRTPEEYQLWQAVRYYDQNYVSLQSLEVLLRHAGHDVKANDYVNYYGDLTASNFRTEKESPASVFQVYRRIVGSQRNRARLSARYVGETLMFEVSFQQQYQRSNAGSGFVGGYGMIGGGGFARGDASRAMVSANAVFSHGAVSGQSFMSHMPAATSSVPELGADSSVSVRRNFSDAAFWNAQVRTDENGKATVTFKLPDSLTNWQVVATTITSAMHVGHSKSSFRTYKPVMVWPILPRIFTEGDVVDVYASVHNRTKQTKEIEVSLEVENGEVVGAPTQTVSVEPESSLPVYWQFKPGDAGYTQLLMTAKSDAGSDASLKRLPVAPMVATQWVTASGFLKDGGVLDVPSTVDLNDAEFEISIVPSLLDDALDTLGYLVEYPHGCVEQTMSRFLPAIAVKGVLDKANVRNAELEEKLPLVAAAGIKRLLELQQADGGWGWHGGSQTHEMMTPYAMYGLLQAEKAGYVIPNEKSVQSGLTRLRQFIQNMKTGRRNADRIYCIYVYSHRNELRPEWWEYISLLLDGQLMNGEKLEPNQSIDGMKVADLVKSGELSDYALALALEMACKFEKKGLADRLAKELRRRTSGGEHTAYWKTAKFSRWGNDRFEITAAVLKALVAYDSNDPLIPKVLTFFANTKRGDRWNSTKDTAMILYAICDYLHTQPHFVSTTDSLELNVGDWSEKVSIDPSKVTTVKVPVKQLLAGDNRIGFVGDMRGAMFRAVLTYYERGTAIEPMEKGIAVTREYFLLDDQGKQVRKLSAGDTVARGSYIQSVVTATHQTDDQMQYVLIENPKPASCEILPVTDTRFVQTSTRCALREDKTRGVAYHHERTPKTLVDRCVLHAELSGTFMIPPAKAELMYNTLEKGHSDDFHFSVE